MAEIVAYNQDNHKFYLVNGREKKLDIVSPGRTSPPGRRRRPSPWKPGWT